MTSDNSISAPVADAIRKQLADARNALRDVWVHPSSDGSVSHVINAISICEALSQLDSTAGHHEDKHLLRLANKLFPARATTNG